MKLRILTTLSLLLLIQYATGQTTKINRYINNDSIRFELLSVMPDFENGIFYSDYALVVKSLDSTQWSYVKTIDKKKWMRLLNDRKTDWAANVILYSLYKRSAGVFRVAIKSREMWVDNYRKEDIAYWQSFLK
jgi:hypothetical protein